VSEVEALRTAWPGRFLDHLGLEHFATEPGTSCCRIALREHHLNYNDVAHGGVVSALVDAAAGLAVRSLRSEEEIAARPHATSDLHVSYLAPARGSELVARGRVIKSGRTAIFAEVTVEDDHGRPVARGMATFVINSRPLKRAD
jgi:uncharacterized protein (TIGR00369 family)